MKTGRRVLGQCAGRAHPHGLELLGVVGFGLLALGHAGHQKRHVIAPGMSRSVIQWASRCIVGTGQGQAVFGNLGIEAGFAVERGHYPAGWPSGHRGGGPAECPVLQSFRAWRPMDWVRARSLWPGAARGQGVGLGIGCVDAAAGEHRHRAIKLAVALRRHQHFKAAGQYRATTARWRQGGEWRAGAGGGGIGRV